MALICAVVRVTSWSVVNAGICADDKATIWSVVNLTKSRVSMTAICAVVKLLICAVVRADAWSVVKATI